MNLRREFDSILETYGHNILLVRSDKALRCSCWDEKTKSADRECPVCFGKGWVPVVEKHTVRAQDTSVPESLTFLGQDSPRFGPISVPGRQYYMRHDVDVKPTDLLVDVEWSKSGKPIYNGGGIYEVSHITPYRFERGEKIYQSVYVKDEPVQKAVRGIRIANFNGIKNYEIMEG